MIFKHSFFHDLLQQFGKIRILVKNAFIDWIHMLFHFLSILIIFIIDFLGLSGLLVRLALGGCTVASSVSWPILLLRQRTGGSRWGLYGNWFSGSLALISHSHAAVIANVFAVHFRYLVRYLLFCALTSVWSSCWLRVFIVFTFLSFIF